MSTRRILPAGAARALVPAVLLTAALALAPQVDTLSAPPSATAPSASPAPRPPPPKAGTPEDAAKIGPVSGPVPTPVQVPAPEDCLRRMKVAPGFAVSLAAAEPDVRQPVAISFDGKGRLWVLQYLQYPEPAGLRPVSRDQYLRTVWDRVPEPPPAGPKGLDRLTILADDGTGRFKPVRDFVAGLNLASGFCIGHGPKAEPGGNLVHGVYVAQPPYLLFYPDADRDDVPDGDPVVICGGWGMEDSHAFPNSLQWGPDGRLYGAVGSTVTNKVRGLEFQQGVWRYDPRDDRFELFSEGGGNTWGLDFDARGNVIAGTNWGGKAMLHQFPGAYYVKGFGKHGPLHNPHAYGYFDHVPVEGFVGGHVTCGGIVYNGGRFGPEWAGRYIAGNLLSHAVYWYDMKPAGASFTARHGGSLIEADDGWFRPIDCLTGPDGAVYVADWCDPRATHLDPRDTWHKQSGRIWRIAPTGQAKPGTAKPDPAPADVDALPAGKLVELLSHPNHWWRREALRVFAAGEVFRSQQIARKGDDVEFRLRREFKARDGLDALPFLWALECTTCRFFDVFPPLAQRDPAVVAWAVRLWRTSQAEYTLKMLEEVDSPVLRAQVACTIRGRTSRLVPEREAEFNLLRKLLTFDADADDPHIPLLLWWAIETHAIAFPDKVLDLLATPEDWQRPLMARHLLERIARRYAAEGTDAAWAVAAKLLDRAPDEASARTVRRGLEKAVEGRKPAEPPAALRGVLAKLPLTDPAAVRFALRLGHGAALEAGLNLLSDAKTPAAERAALVPVLAESGRPEVAAALPALLDKAQPVALRAAALAGLGRYADPELAERVLAEWPGLPGNLRAQAVTMLAARPAWAGKLLDAVDAGTIKPAEVALDAVRAMQDAAPALKPRLEKHWGRVGRATPGELQARASYIQHVVLSRNRGKGDPAAGKVLFTKHCATCHQLHGEGTKIGPDLTGANRADTAWLVGNVVDPNSVVRAEYGAWIVRTTDERVLTGLLVEQSDAAVTLLDGKNVRTVLPRADVDEMKASPLSLMPEKLLDTLTDAELVHLFAYLQQKK